MPLAINDIVTLLPERVEVKVLGMVAGMALISHPTIGTMQVPFRRLQGTVPAVVEVPTKEEEPKPAEEAPLPEPTVEEVLKVTGDILAANEEAAADAEEVAEIMKTAEEVAEIMTPPPPETQTTSSTTELDKLVFGVAVPKRLTKKWMDSQTVDFLELVLGLDISAARKKSVSDHLKTRKD